VIEIIPVMRGRGADPNLSAFSATRGRNAIELVEVRFGTLMRLGCAWNVPKVPHRAASRSSTVL